MWLYRREGAGTRKNALLKWFRLVALTRHCISWRPGVVGIKAAQVVWYHESRSWIEHQINNKLVFYSRTSIALLFLLRLPSLLVVESSNAWKGLWASILTITSCLPCLTFHHWLRLFPPLYPPSMYIRFPVKLIIPSSLPLVICLFVHLHGLLYFRRSPKKA